MTMILTSVTMMAWADVPDSDRGDFRRRRAIDISNSFMDTVNQLSFFVGWNNIDQNLFCIWSMFNVGF